MYIYPTVADTSHAIITACTATRRRNHARRCGGREEALRVARA